MRKNLFSVLAVIMSIALCSCGKSQAARSVDQMIKSIGEVTLESESLILEAEAAAEALAEEDRVQLDNLEMLASARETYDTLFEASEVDEAISQIGEITLESSTAVTLARKKYDKCSDAVKACVTKLAELEAAEKELRTLQAEKAAEVDQAILDIGDITMLGIGDVTIENKEAIAYARGLYNSCSSDIKAMVTKLSNLTIAENKYKAAEVDQAISEIGKVTPENKDTVAEIREKYDACTTAVKSYVTKLADLEAAEESVVVLQKEEVQNMLSKMRVEDDEVRNLKFYYSKTQPNYVDVRCYVLPYIGQSSSNTWLCAHYNYTADDWVFFRSITFAVDDERYYKSFRYYDIIHDNSGGEVWEYMNTADVTDKDIEMFWAIANSTKTIVRFQGNDYHYDFIVSDEDKQAIREVLTAYELLLLQ